MTAIVGSAPPTVLQFFDNRGNPAAGGSVLTQVASVNYPTYQDSAGATPLPNPIPLNSRGEVSNSSGVSCQLFLVSGVTYTFTLYDSAGNQLNQATSVQGIVGITNLSASSGSSLIGFIQAGTGAVARTVQSKERDIVSAKDFGLSEVATAAANKLALTSAIAAVSTYGGTVFVPTPVGAAYYLCASGVVVPNNVEIRGDSSGNNWNLTTSATTSTGVAFLFSGSGIGFDLTNGNTPSNTFGCTLRNLLVMGNNALTTGIKACNMVCLDNVGVSYCTGDGIWLFDYTLNTRISNCTSVSNGGWGVKVSGTAGTNRITTVSLDRVQTQGNVLGGLSVTHCTGMTVKDFIAENNYGSAISIIGDNLGNGYPSVTSVKFIGGYLEGNGTNGNVNYAYAPSILIDVTAGGIAPKHITFGGMELDDSCRDRVKITNGLWVKFMDCRVLAPYTSSDITHWRVYLGAGAQYCSFIDTLTTYDATFTVVDNVYVTLYDTGLYNQVINSGGNTASYVLPCSGPFASQNCTVYYQRRDNQVTLLFTGIIVAGNSTAAPITFDLSGLTTTQLANITPLITQFLPVVIVEDNGTVQTAPGMFEFTGNGASMTISLTAVTTNFTSTASNVGFKSFSVTYLIAE